MLLHVMQRHLASGGNSFDKSYNLWYNTLTLIGRNKPLDMCTTFNNVVQTTGDTTYD